MERYTLQGRQLDGKEHMNYGFKKDMDSRKRKNKL